MNTGQTISQPGGPVKTTHQEKPTTKSTGEKPVFLCGCDAEEESRTPTPLRALRPERSVYTISPLRQERRPLSTSTRKLSRLPQTSAANFSLRLTKTRPRPYTEAVYPAMTLEIGAMRADNFLSNLLIARLAPRGPFQPEVLRFDPTSIGGLSGCVFLFDFPAPPDRRARRSAFQSVPFFPFFFPRRPASALARGGSY